MGAHSSAPSMIHDNVTTQSVPLDGFIETNPREILGSKVLASYGPALPYLVKILSASAPLSLQVHPSKAMAEKGFLRENAQSIPLSDPIRCYKDVNHKPEVLIAVTPFTALCGFRDIHDTTRLFEMLNDPAAHRSISLLRKAGNYSDFYDSLFKLDLRTRDSLIKRCLSYIPSSNDDSNTFAICSKLNTFYPGDIGILAPLFLNPVELKSGEAIYIPSGIMHTYLEGTGIELMANSDNVLRGGLTKKHIDQQELLNAMNPTPSAPFVIKPHNPGPLFTYSTPSSEFELTRLDLDDSTTEITFMCPLICFSSDGYICVTAQSGETAIVQKGTSLFVPAYADKLTIKGNGTLFIAGIPDFYAIKNENLD